MSDEIKRRFEHAKSVKQPFDNDIRQAYLYTSPAQDPQRTEGQPVDRNHLYDGTADDAVNTVVNHTLMFLMADDRQWASLQVSEAYKAKGLPLAQMNLLLSQQTAIFFDEVRESNLRLRTGEALRDWFISGSACIALEVTDYGIRYSAVPINQLYYLENGDCEIDVVFREHRLPARTIEEKYGKKGTIPTWIKDLAREKPDTLVDVVEAMTPKGKKFDYGFYTLKNFEPIYETTLTYQRYIVFRFDCTSGNAWGDSLVRRALPIIFVTNKIAEDIITHGEFASKGSYLTNDDALQDLQIRPGEFTFTTKPGDTVPLGPAGQFSISLEMLQDGRQQIRQALMADVLPPVGETHEMTAVEVNTRYQQFFRRVGTAALRIEQEYLRPLVYNSIKALQSESRMAKADALNLDGDVVNIETNSLVRRVEAMRRIEDAMTQIAMVAQLGPAGLMHIDMPKVGRWVLETGNFPPELLKDPAQVEQELKTADMAQAAGGAITAMRGQGNQEGNQATGQAMGRLLTQMTGQKAA